MKAENFIEKLNLLQPEICRIVDKNFDKMHVDWSSYKLSYERKEEYRFEIERLSKEIDRTINIWNFIIDKEDTDFSFDFEQEGFYPFGFYAQDYLFINLKTKRIEARDLVLTKYYDVAKDEEAFLEAFLIFAKHYAYSLENPVEQPDYYSLYLSISLDQRREILKEVLKIVGGKKYRPFWVQVFQGWTDEELKEMGE